VSDPAVAPADAKKALYQAMALGGVTVVPSYVASDLANVRRAFPNDAAFAEAVVAVAKEIMIARRSPSTHGVPVQHELSGWRRSAFESAQGANLRLVFRPSAAGGLEILAFGDRNFPDTVYFTAKNRV